jgi:fimbrial chaperone protein
MCRVKLIALTAMLASSAIGQANAQSLRVSPVTIDLPVSIRSSILTVANDSRKPITVQARILHWTQDGADILEKTSNVVVSPPIFTLGPGTSNVVRVVRVSPEPVTEEETYRVLLDEVPSREKIQAGGLVIVMRQSLPVFFSGMDAKTGSVSWTATRRNNKLVLQATNSGQKHLKLTMLQVTDDKAEPIAKIEGLAGYVLGGQSRSWELPLPKSGLAAGATLKIEATSEAGPVNASAVVGKSS